MVTVFHSLAMSFLIFLRRFEMIRELERVASELVTVMYIILHSEDETFILTTSLPDRLEGAKR